MRAFLALTGLYLVLVLLMLGCTKTQSCYDSSKINPHANCSAYGYNPVCGCDDITYYNPCEADSHGVREYIGGPCL